PRRRGEVRGYGAANLRRPEPKGAGSVPFRRYGAAASPELLGRERFVGAGGQGTLAPDRRPQSPASSREYRPRKEQVTQTALATRKSRAPFRKHGFET